MTSQRLSAEDLIVMARRGKLPADQTEAFDRMMRTSPEARELHRLGRAFDRVDPVQPGDEALVGRAVEAALRQRQTRRSAARQIFGSRRLGPWLIAAMVMGSAATALGLANLYVRIAKHDSTETAAPIAPVNAPARAAKGRRAGTAESQRTAEVPDPVAPTEPGTAPEPLCSSNPVVASENESQDPVFPAAQKALVKAIGSASRTIASTSLPGTNATGSASRAGASDSELGTGPNNRQQSSAPADRSNVPTAAFEQESPSPTAAELFESANQARRQGNLAMCIRQYRRLQYQFASSGEAQLSHVSLGKVLQATGDFGAAVTEFSAYLNRSGSLEEEALVGRAESLARLGRTAEEAADWQRLLTRSKNSVYSGRANERLSAIRAMNMR